MARGDKTNDILKQIAEEANGGSADAPEFIEIEGVKYRRADTIPQAPGSSRRKALWTNPRKPNDPPEERWVEDVVINVAPYADRITLDSVIFFAGNVYTVPCEQAATIREVCQRTWQHEASTGGAYSHGTNQSVRGTRSQVGAAAPGLGFG